MEECIFCFEKLSLNNIQLYDSYKILRSNNIDINIFSEYKDDDFKNLISSYENYFLEMKSCTLNLDCGHNYHYGCFLKYIKCRYNTTLLCPLCRSDVKRDKLECIIKTLYPIKLSRDYITRISKKIYNKILFEKTILYLNKFTFRKKFSYKRFLKYNDLIQSYQDILHLSKRLDAYTRLLYL